MAWYWWALAALLAIQLPAGILLGRLLRQRDDDPGLTAVADAVTQPPGILDDAIPLATSIWTCDCVCMYLRSGDVLFVSCGTHRRHASWQAWEAQMTTTEGPA